MFDAARSAEPDPVSDAAGELAGVLSDAAHTALGTVAALDLDRCDGFDLMMLVSDLEATRRLLDAAEAHALAALHEGKVTEHCDGLSTTAWLARQANLPYGTARQRVTVAGRLGTDLEPVDRALRDGRIGFDHARVLAGAVNDRNRHAMEPALDALIDAATVTDFAHWRNRVQGLAELADLDGPHDPADDLTRNRLHLSPSDDFLLLRGELVGEARLSVGQAIETVADELFRQWDRDREVFPDIGVPDRATLRALALDEICRRALATDLDSTQPARTGITITLHDRTCPRCDGIDGAALSADDRRFVGTVFDPLGTPIPASTVPAFLCDADFHALLLDAAGVPLDAGRTLPTPTREQRRALAHRDGGCVFPGCHLPPSWADAHHLHERQHGGIAELRNLVLLCRHHHRVAHRTGWAVELTDDGWTRWTTPDGRTRWGQRHHRLRAGP